MPARSRFRPACPATPRFKRTRRLRSGAREALLDRFGYKDRDGDGFRELPDGKPLALVMGIATSGRDRELDELWKKSLNAIGVRIDFIKQKWPDLLKMGRAGKLQMWRVGWISAYNEGERSCSSCIRRTSGSRTMRASSCPRTTRCTARPRKLPDGPERTALYRRMSEIVNAQNPWDLGVYRIENTLVRPWVEGYKKHAFFEHDWKYYDLDVAKQKAGR